MNVVVNILEIDVDLCGVAGYGVSPCTASGGPPCLHGLGTCQDLPNFDSDGMGGKLGTVATWRFASRGTWSPESGIDAYPLLESISYTPASIELSEGLGSRATLTAEMGDAEFADTGPLGDPYLDERDYTYPPGTFWTRWPARNPYLQGRTARWRQGLLGQSLEEFETRHFIVERFEPPGLNSRARFIFRDALQALFDDRSQCPPPTPGRLSAGLSDSATSATLVPSGVGDLYYSSAGSWIAIGSEIIGFSRSGDNLTLSRHLWGTTPQAHDAGAQVQQCADDFIAVRPDEAAAILATKYASVPLAQIPAQAWEDEIDAHYGGGLLTTLVAKPTATRSLFKELAREVGLSIWQDDRTGLVQLQVIRTIDTDAVTFDARFAPGESNVVVGSFTVTPGEKRISQALCYYGQVNPLDGVDRGNLPVFAASVAAEDEILEGVPALDETFSRWITSGGASAAQAVCDRRLARFVKAPRTFTFNLPRWGSFRPVLGQGCNVLADCLRDAFGAHVAVPGQIVRVNPNALNGAEFEITVQEVRMDARFAPAALLKSVTISAAEYNVNFKTKYETQYVPAVAGDEVYLIVNEAVVTGSTSTSVAGITIGDWPTQAETATRTSGSPVLTGLADTADLAAGQGVVGTGIPRGAQILSVDSGSQITLDVNATSSGSGSISIGLVIIHVLLGGTAAGKGGLGGRGYGGDNNPGGTGQAGGVAIYTRVPIRLERAGLVLAPGGGGGGGAGDYVGFFGPQVNGPGGGGGAGAEPGDGGPGASSAGYPGTLTAGGAGRASSPSSQGWGSGAGGAPGSAGSPGYGYSPGAGGAAGRAIDGWSYVNDDDWTGTITGTTIN